MAIARRTGVGTGVIVGAVVVILVVGIGAYLAFPPESPKRPVNIKLNADGIIDQEHSGTFDPFSGEHRHPSRSRRRK